MEHEREVTRLHKSPNQNPLITINVTFGTGFGDQCNLLTTYLGISKIEYPKNILTNLMIFKET